MRFVGVDLAWGERKPSAVVVLEAAPTAPGPPGYEALQARGAAIADGLGPVEAIAAFVLKNAPGHCLVGIDAPLIVPNEGGSRPCDRECTAKWGRFDAGALPANKRLLGNPPRGGALLRLLEKVGFAHRYDLPRARARAVLEVFPHPASVALLGLDRIFSYKRGPMSERRKGLAAYQKRLLADLGRLCPPIALEGELARRLRRDPARLRGMEFQRQADLVDALMCAAAAFHFWRWGEARWEVLGELEEGTILVPKAEAYGLPARG